MSKVKELYIEAKKSFAFQTYTVGILTEIDENENVDELTRAAQAKCRKLCQEQIDIDKGKGLK